MTYGTLAALSLVMADALCAQTAARTVAPGNAEFEALQSHFERAVNERARHMFDGMDTAAKWETRKTRMRAELTKMLWHDRRFPDSVPAASITRREERPGYILENLVIEAAPAQFITANLYLPREGSKPFPVVLYQVGHANKNYYKKHGLWFASHGIAALVMDNIEAGEIEFTHHGIYSHAWFHWYSRGFSPLAVELFHARRAVDYLVSRSDLDRKRVGATGRSGGGMTTFFLAALDERIRASAPVSGTLSTRGWVQHRLTSAHCDCQFPVNSYGLHYSEIGALIAPRAQLQCNAQADPGFPMDSFEELLTDVRKVYKLYNAGGALQSATVGGGHNDIEAIRLPVYSFFLKEFLGKETPVTAEGPLDQPTEEELICFRSGTPLQERLTRVDEDLIPLRSNSTKPLLMTLIAELRNEVFRYFPKQEAVPLPVWGEKRMEQGRTMQRVNFASFDGLTIKAVYSLPAGASQSRKLPAILVADHRRGIPAWGNKQPLERGEWGNSAVLIVETIDSGSRALERNLRSYVDNDPVHHMKRQAMVAGTTIESMQVYEILRSIQLLRTLPQVDPSRVAVTGKGEMGVNAMYASLLDGSVSRVILQSPPGSHRQGPHYLGILRYTDIPETAALLSNRLRVYGEVPPELTAVRRCVDLQECLMR